LRREMVHRCTAIRHRLRHVTPEYRR
jgi:hypothetical protein